MDEDDLFAELCGVSVSAMEDTQEDAGVLRQELCIAVERGMLETSPAAIDSAIASFQEGSSDGDARLLSALQSAKLVCEGRYADVIRTEFGLRVMAAITGSDAATRQQHIASDVTTKLAALLSSTPENERAATCYEILLVGVALLNLFVQANYTGPALEAAGLRDVIALVARVLGAPDGDDKALRQAALPMLQVDGEMAFTICEFPYFLAVARAVLHFTGNAAFANWSVAVQTFGSHDEDEDVTPTNAVDASLRRELESTLASAAWWNARAAVVHSRLLIAKEPSNTLWYEARRGFVQTLRHPTLFEVARGEYLRARAHVEWGLAQHFFDKNKQGKRSFETAQEISGLSVQLSGSLGKRTKFQQRSVAQMVLLAKSKYPPTAESDSVYATAMADATDAELGGRRVGSKEEVDELVQRGEATYREVQLNQVDEENILLERIAFEDASLTEQGNLQTMDQVILLARCLDVKNSNANDGLTREEMLPYVSRVLENPNNWMVYSTALLERAWLECEATRRRERAVLQMQALVDQHTTRLTVLQSSMQAIEDAAPAHERMQFVYALAFPPQYALKRDLAERYFSMGVLRSALDLCLELEIWDDVVRCYQVLDQPTKAEETVRARLAVAPSPYMWTALGDITLQIEHYETAWQLSQRRYARAKRSLGRYFFEHGDYKTAIAHYEDSVEVNPMNASSWFVIGTMSMRLQDWARGLRALTRVVQLEPDNGEAWGNIGSIHMNNGRFHEAYTVLQEALKQKREMWQMWENYAYCALQIERFGEVLYAMHQWLDLRQKHKRPVDHELLAWLVEAVVFPDAMKQKIGRDAHTEEAAAAELQALGDEDDENRADDDEDIRELDEAALATDATPPRSASNYKKQLAMLFGRITSIVTNDAKIWQVYARFNDGVGRPEKALDCRLKMCRALQTAQWETEQSRVEELCRAAVRLAQDYMADGSKKALYACRLYLRGVLKKAQVDFERNEDVQALAETLEKVETAMAALA
ncbi:hypothetical protein P43SY_003369 [Pythium insidiosum]|uniref:Tetratricopeptide repeat protein n=1 Tax=Pythium insidiosum TaxID=114742 RepID=A0AAD5Q9W5_PYTIN|nr:hypothetical protein P43SY_003369 [Pythium insidiosum]